MDNSFASALKEIVAKAPAEHQARYERDTKVVLDNGITTREALLQALENPSQTIEVQQIACWVLGQLGEPQAIGPLLEALKRQKPEICFEAAKSLVSLAANDSSEQIVAIMSKGENAPNRAAAAYALGMLRVESAVEDLISVLEGNDTVEVRSHAAEALGNLSDKDAVDSLVRALTDDSPEVRFWSAFALGEIGDRKALTELEELAAADDAVLHGYGSVRREAQNAINRIHEASKTRPNKE